MTVVPARPARQGDLSAGRWSLLGALILALLTMVVLSGHDSAGHHRVLTATPAATAAHADAAPLGATLTSVDEPSGDGHGIVAGCAVLLLAAGAVALAGALRRRPVERRPPALWSVRAGGLRGPPPALSRRALCVERI